MEKDFQCIKIKDGLYLGNIKASQDFEFLISNKFQYMLNCASEIPNYFEDYGLKYLKLKFVRDKMHKLWDFNNLTKLQKVTAFIKKAQKSSVCCLMFSYDGNNRSLVILSGYLMCKYKWTASKTLQFIRSKNVFIGLSEYYIQQLELLEKILQQTIFNEDGIMTQGVKLTNDWKGPYLSEQQQLLSKTFLNSLYQDTIQKNKLSQDFEIKNPSLNQANPQKKAKRVSWKDKIQKEKPKEKKQKKEKKKSNSKFPVEPINNQDDQPIMQDKHQKTYQMREKNHSWQQIKPQKTVKPQLANDGLMVKKSNKNYAKNIQLHKILERRSSKEQQQFEAKQQSQSQQYDQAKQADLRQEELLKILSNNIHFNRKQFTTLQNTEKEDNKEKVFNLTINNFIQPNINLVNPMNKSSSLQKKRKQKQKQNSKGKQEKVNRTCSEKQTIKGFNLMVKDKINKLVKKQDRQKSTNYSKKVKKSEKSTSTQILRKNK